MRTVPQLQLAPHLQEAPQEQSFQGHDEVGSTGLGASGVLSLGVVLSSRPNRRPHMAEGRAGAGRE